MICRSAKTFIFILVLLGSFACTKSKNKPVDNPAEESHFSTMDPKEGRSQAAKPSPDKSPIPTATPIKTPAVETEIKPIKFLKRSPFPNGFTSHFAKSTVPMNHWPVWLKTKELFPAAILFPGLELANQYDWKSGKISKNGKRVKGYRKVLLRKFLKNVNHTNSKVYYVLNPFESIDKIEALLKEIIRRQGTVGWFQFGHAPYEKENLKRLGGSQKYFAKAREIQTLIKKHKLAAPLVIPAHTDLNAKWNIEVSNTKFQYISFPFQRPHGPGVLPIKVGAKALEETIKAYTKLFPRKKLILNSWNIVHKPTSPIFGTLTHALLLFDYYQVLLGAKIELALYDGLNGKQEILGPNIFNDKYHWEQLPRPHMLRRVPYYAHFFIGEALLGVTRYTYGKKGDLNYLIFFKETSYRVLAWTDQESEYLIAPASTFNKNLRFVKGQVLQGKLNDHNGNINRWREDQKKMPWKAVLNKELVARPLLRGPGMGLFYFSSDQFIK